MEEVVAPRPQPLDAQAAAVSRAVAALAQSVSVALAQEVSVVLAQDAAAVLDAAVVLVLVLDFVFFGRAARTRNQLQR